MRFTALLFSLCVAAFGLTASAQVSTEVISPGATVTTPPGSTVTTIVETPNDSTKTTVTSSGGVQSMMYKLRDGHRLEVDSDDSAYIVYDDGARVTAPDGIHTLMAGTTMTVKNGKVIP